MRRGAYVAIIVAGLGVGLWWLWPQKQPKAPREQPVVAAGGAAHEPVRRQATGSGTAIVADNGGQAAVPSKAAVPSDEDALVDEMRAILKSDPKRAEELGRIYQERFPGGARLDEADALLVYALYNQGLFDSAGLEAIHYFEHHPKGRYTEKLTKLTRMRPPRRR